MYAREVLTHDCHKFLLLIIKLVYYPGATATAAGEVLRTRIYNYRKAHQPTNFPETQIQNVSSYN